jgi:transcriptional regulator with XRE-family HTH domain
MYNRISSVLNEKNVNQDFLARGLKLTPSKISRWCSNNTQPNAEALYSIAKFLRVDISALLYATSKTISIRGKVDLAELGVNDALLQLVVGQSTLQNIQLAHFRIKTDFKNGREIHEPPLSLIGFVSLKQNPKIPIIELQHVVQNCKFSTLEVVNCNEELRLTFLCPQDEQPIRKRTR